MKVRRIPLSRLPPGAIDRLVGDHFFASEAFAQLWRAKGGRPVVWAVVGDGPGGGAASRGGTPGPSGTAVLSGMPGPRGAAGPGGGAGPGDAAGPRGAAAAIVAIVPGVEFGRGPIARFASMPDGCYGGVFFAEGRDDGPAAALSAEHERLARMLLDAVARRRYLRAHLFDFYGTLPADPRFETFTCTTTLVDISDPRWDPPDKTLLAQIRKARREGIHVEPFDWSRHRDSFLQLMRATERRHGQRPRFSRRFFARLAALAQRDERVQWLWCEHDGHPAASHIYVLEHGVLQGWQIYFDKAFSFLKPNQYMRFTTCRAMLQRGIHWLNLGGTPENAPGLASYKRRWGGEVIRYPGYVRSCGPGRWL
jgi:hypothetical protein